MGLSQYYSISLDNCNLSQDAFTVTPMFGTVRWSWFQPMQYLCSIYLGQHVPLAKIGWHAYSGGLWTLGVALLVWLYDWLGCDIDGQLQIEQWLTLQEVPSKPEKGAYWLPGSSHNPIVALWIAEGTPLVNHQWWLVGLVLRKCWEGSVCHIMTTKL